MKVLIACEESQAVVSEMRRLGHEAYSCDLLECSGGHPGWHIQGDCLKIINGKCEFQTMDGATHRIRTNWDLIIAHPPCTYLSIVTNRHLSLRMNPPEKIIARMWDLAKAAAFFMQMALADCEHICVENPLGYMSRLWRKPDQIIEPYYFAESTEDIENYEHKRTCLWLKGLEPLQRRNQLPPAPKSWSKSGKPLYFEEHARGNRAKVRSKTFPGIAQAMAEQWAGPCEKEETGSDRK